MDNFLLLPRALATALSDIAFAGAFGLIVTGLWLKDDLESHLRETLRRSAVFCALGMLVALCAQMYLVTATMTGSAAYESVRGQLVEVVTGTHVGRGLVYNALFSLALLGLLSIKRGGQTRVRIWSLFAILAILAAIRSAPGHSASDGDFTLPEFVQFFHLIAIAIWAGCVIASGLFVLPAMLRPQRMDAIADFVRRLSRTVTPALLLVVLSGVYNSYRGLGGSAVPLVRTQWGGLLDLKIVFVLAAVTMGAFSRRMLQKNRNLTAPQIYRLSTALRMEATIMLIILTVSACLANSPPAG